MARAEEDRMWIAPDDRRKLMRVLLTGGAGYLGTSVVAELSEHPDVSEIVVYDNLSRGNRSFFLGGPGSGQPGAVSGTGHGGDELLHQ